MISEIAVKFWRISIKISRISHMIRQIQVAISEDQVKKCGGVRSSYEIQSEIRQVTH